MKKYDERETLFSRLNLEKGSKEYLDFYEKNNDRQHLDDPLRRISFRHKLRKPDEFKRLFFPIIEHNKKYIKALYDLSSNYPIKELVGVSPGFSNNIKEITKYYGAASVGIVKLDDFSYYSHFGGLSEEIGIKNYNKPIKPSFRTAIVFTVKMDLEMINRAPHFEELLATEQAYLRVAEVGSRLEMYLKSLGYKAVSNNSEFYLAPMVPLAYEAGLGEIGMCNHLVTLEHGDNVRIGAVFTNLVVDYDKPVDFGLKEFCKKCALCLMNCPSKAISHKPRMVNGRQFYKFDDNLCYEMWVNSGTDCGTCIQSCPFTQGVDLDKARQMKNNPKMMEEIMKEHFEKHGRRRYIKQDLNIVKIGEKK
ncbi:MAG: hypothetical protein KJ847_00840 [Firmicutes bacterium]|nr:hypothetical protein [Bacillota bacterium]